MYHALQEEDAEFAVDPDPEDMDDARQVTGRIEYLSREYGAALSSPEGSTAQAIRNRAEHFIDRFCTSEDPALCARLRGSVLVLHNAFVEGDGDIIAEEVERVIAAKTSC